jgi:hypothetical protein
MGFSKDLNREAFSLYKQNKFSQAEKLLIQETQQNPTKHFAWLNLARVTFAKVKDHPELELFECLDSEKFQDEAAGLSVGFKVLHYLSRAVELNKKEVIDKLNELDPHFESFKKEEQFLRWLKAIDLPQDPKKVEAFLTSNEWIPYSNNMDQNPEINNWNTYYVFSADFKVRRMQLSDLKRKQETQESGQEWAKWSVKKDGMLEIERKGKKLSTKLTQFKVLKKTFFFSAKIPTNSENGIAFILGPRVGDCGEFNF